MWFPGDDLFTPVERRRGMPHRQPDQPVFRQRLPRPARSLRQRSAGAQGYVRYVDDFLVFSDDKRRLPDVREQIREFLVGFGSYSRRQKRGLSVQAGNPVSWLPGLSHAPPACQGECPAVPSPGAGDAAGFCGRAALTFDAIRQRLMSWIGHARQANTYRLRADLFRTIRFQRATTESPCLSGRVVQQSTVERPLGQP